MNAPNSRAEGFEAVGQVARSSECTHRIREQRALKWSEAVNAPKIGEQRVVRRCGQAARSSECIQDSRAEGFEVVRSSECTQDSRAEGFEAVRAGCAQQ